LTNPTQPEPTSTLDQPNNQQPTPTSTLDQLNNQPTPQTNTKNHSTPPPTLPSNQPQRWSAQAQLPQETLAVVGNVAALFGLWTAEKGLADILADGYMTGVCVCVGGWLCVAGCTSDKGVDSLGWLGGNGACACLVLFFLLV